LTYTEGGRGKTLTLSAAEVPEVRAALKRYGKAKAELDAAANKGLAALQRRRGSRRKR
jgi:hypothetical protein